MNERDTILEFVQWLANDPGRAEDLAIFIEDDDPEMASFLIDEFLEGIGV